jgi:surface antigen
MYRSALMIVDSCSQAVGRLAFESWMRATSMSVTRFRCALAPLFLASMLPVCSTAQNTSFLKDAAVSKFDEQDVSLMMKNVDTALNEPLIPVTREWKNAASGNSGKAEITSAFTSSDGARCKRARLSNFARNGIKGTSTYTFCNREQKWMIMPGNTK